MVCRFGGVDTPPRHGGAPRKQLLRPQPKYITPNTNRRYLNCDGAKDTVSTQFPQKHYEQLNIERERTCDDKFQMEQLLRRRGREAKQQYHALTRQCKFFLRFDVQTDTTMNPSVVVDRKQTPKTSRYYGRNTRWSNDG